MKKLIFTIIALAIAIYSLTCSLHADQVYATQAGNAITFSTNAPPDSTAADWQKALGDFGINVSIAGIMAVLAVGIPLVKALAGYARKVIPLSSQVNTFGLLLAHLAGIDSPSIPMLQSLAAAEPAAKSATLTPVK